MKRLTIRHHAVLAIHAAIAAPVAAQPCTPEWSPLGDGMGGAVHALTVFDDGAGPALYAGGEFTTAGGLPANYIARWDPLLTTWSALGAGADDAVNDLAVFDDGTGPALYAAGYFSGYIARWDGVSLSPLGGGADYGIFDMEVFDDGGGPALYAGGFLTSAGGVAAGWTSRTK